MAVLIQPFRRVLHFYSDRAYFQELFRLVLPIAAQNLLTSSLALVSTLMIGQRGATAVAAVGLADQIFFLLNLVLFGLGGGSAIFTAQLWGKKDIRNVRRVLGFCLTLSMLVAGALFTLAVFFPEFALGLYSTDPAVIALGSQYLRIYGWSYFFFAISFSYALILRSIGEVKPPVIVSVSALFMNIFLAYALIFGRFGFPEMGVPGAAAAGLAARIFECTALIAASYLIKTPIASRLNEIFSLDFSFFKKIFMPVLPVILNELLWSLGVTTYNAIYAHIGTNAIAAINIFSAVDQLALVLFFAITAGNSIMVGNRIGAGDTETAYRYAGRSLGLVMVLAWVMGILVYSSAGYIFVLYKVPPIVIDYAYRLLFISCALLWIRAMNSMLMVAILRAGGDTWFAFFLDGVIIWILGVPMAHTGAAILNLPIYGVYLMVMSEEVAKWSLGLYRYFTRKWINNLTQIVPA